MEFVENKKRVTLFFFVLLLFIVAYFPVLKILVGKWAASDEYAHAFFTVPIIVYMIWCKREQLGKAKGNTSVGFFCVTLSVIFYLISIPLQIPTLSFLAMTMFLISALIYLAGFMALKELAMPILLFIMIIPIPNQIYSLITIPLQLKVTQLSEQVIQLLGIPIYREGNVISLPGKSFQVVEACSGLRSLITLTTLSLIMGYFTLRTTWTRVLLLLLSVPVAFFVNTIRVLVLVLAYYYFQLDLATGTVHTVLGVLIFGIALVSLFFLQRMMEQWERK